MDNLKFLRLTMGAVAVTWLVLPFGVFLVMPSWEHRGQFGDMFGAVNALFSGLGFAGLLYTIVLQQNQLSMQRDELALQREELKLQRGEMVASRVEMANQTQVQRAQMQISIEQVFVAATQARIEAHKVTAMGAAPAWQEVLAKRIDAEADNLTKVGEALKDHTRDLVKVIELPTGK